MHVASLYISVIMFKYSANETFLVAVAKNARAVANVTATSVHYNAYYSIDRQLLLH